MNLFEHIFKYNMFRKDDLAGFVAKFYYDGERSKQYIVRFIVLIFLSTIIATYGVLDDSTATVIGAMIIAPLMLPIMGIATALVMGRLDRALKSFVLVTIGVFIVVAVSWFLSKMYLGFISLDANDQITSRVSPAISDLLIALASGAVAGFAMSRDDISDSLPGAAISIALVPPLAVVGVCLSVGNMQMAGGAFLLFFTNFLSIIIAGGLVLHVLGLNKLVKRQIKEQEAIKKVFHMILIGVIIVVVPLTFTTFKMLKTVTIQNEAKDIVTDWTGDSGYVLHSLDVSNNIIDIVVAGSGEIPSFSDLVNELESITDDVLVIKLNAIQTQMLQYPEKNQDNITN